MLVEASKSVALLFLLVPFWWDLGTLEILQDHPGTNILPHAPQVSLRSASHSFAGTSNSVSSMSRFLAKPRKAEAAGDDTASMCAASWRYAALEATRSVMAMMFVVDDFRV